jgi:cysteine sulfinate desulfinase/cysteine desulfurase-like protein
LGYIDNYKVKQAIFSTSGKKVLGPDGIGAAVIRLLWEWDPDRITVLV